MSRGLGHRQQAILDHLAAHHELARRTGREPQWVTLRELAGLVAAEAYRHHRAEVESTRRALRGLAAVGLVELALVRPQWAAQEQLGARLMSPGAE
jgi:hypothetical protein